MPTRRSFTAMAAAGGVLVATSPMTGRAIAQAAQQAVTFVRDTAERLVTIANGADPPEDMRRSLRHVIDATVDVEDIARACLGRFWRLATPLQQQQYLGLFGDLLVAKIAAQLGEYRGVRVTMGMARAGEGTEIVVTTIVRPNHPTYQVDWVVNTASGDPKIVDLLAEGTSLRLTQSSDFAAYLARHQYNIHELIEAIRELIARSG